MNDIVHFSDADSTRHDRVGGKAANLGRLTQGGFDVPPGFTVSTAAYAAFIGNTGLDKKIRAVLERVDYADTKSADEFAAGLGASITAAYLALGSEVHVAVRSSGSAEDLAEASFAGLHDTYLDIKGSDAVLDAIKRCWASLWTARAMSYRHTRGYDHLQVLIAVVVQTMVESEVAGVMFTGNPMNAANDELVIDASWGLGEAIVGGITTPDEFTVKAGCHRVIEKKLGSKSVRVVRNPKGGHGTTTGPTPDDLRAKFSLSDEQVARLAAT